MYFVFDFFLLSLSIRVQYENRNTTNLICLLDMNFAF